MFHYDFEQSVGYWTIRAAHAFQRAVNEQLSPYGITFRQAQALAWLAHHGTMSQTELAEQMHIEPPTLVGILDRMERDGWIHRRHSPTDRRKNEVSLAEPASAAWEKIVGCGHRVRALALRGFSEAETAELLRLLKRVETNLNTPAAEEVPPCVE